MTETPGEAVPPQAGSAGGSCAGADVPKSKLSPDATLLTAREATDANAETRTGQVGRQATGSTGSAFGVSGDAGSTAPAAMPKSFGRYRIEKILGEGSMGTVYLAYDSQLDRKIALKIPKLDPAEGREVIERFFREARSAANLRNAYICPVYDVGEIDGQCYITMAFIEGRPLKDFITPSKALGEKQIVSTIRKLAAGLGEAHKSGIIHRDLKPANIMIDKKGEPVVMDFGLARKTSGEEEHLTKTGSIVGTPAYMSPEQVDGTAVLGPPTDIYSLGVIFYEMLTQRRPFEGSLLSILTQIGSKEPPKPCMLREGLTLRLEQICLKMMAKQVSERYATMEEVARDLAGSLKLKESTATVPAPETAVKREPAAENTVPMLAPVSQVEPRGQSSSGQKKPPRPAWWMSPFAWGGFGAVLLLGVIVITITNRDGSKVVIEAEDNAKIEMTRKERPATRQGIESGNAVATWQHWPADAPPPAIAPFDAAQALKHQEAWAAYLKVPVEHTNSIGIKFRLIPPGEFMMGSAPAEIDAALEHTGDDKNWQGLIRSAGPRHRVVLTQAIYLSVHEVTQREWEAVMKTNPSHFAPTGMGKEAVGSQETATHPVETVSWSSAAEYCAKLSQQENLKPFYFVAGETVSRLEGTGYRLPTEAEWEFACRAGTATLYSSGDAEVDLLRAGWNLTNAARQTHAVGQLRVNPFGLYDMHGNALEWVQDGYDPTYYQQFAEKAAVNPESPMSPGSLGVCRGGCWFSWPWDCWSASRRALYSTDRNSTLGFRLALTVPSRVTPEVVSGK